MTLPSQHHCRAVARRSRATAEDLARIARVKAIIQGHGTLAEARETAGLSVGQAAKLLGWPRERILALEAGATATTAERGALCDAYDVAGWRDTTSPEVIP